MPNAIITGGSAGLGRALTTELLGAGFTVTITARTADALAATAADLGGRVRQLAGDVTDPDHRDRLVALAAADGPVDVLINNASELGGSPQPQLRDLDRATFERILAVNLVAPLELINSARPHLAPDATIINISSDAAADHYEGWGGYGASKAALDHLTLTLAAEEPDRRWYAIDPGDLRTAMHQAAFPGEDISDRPLPETITPAFLQLIRDRPASGRYRATELIGADR
ncbi:SDR family oxidoreductase [Microlunatus speluncae]|uniref:SDR family oxidoreductase n=1 Tax=Microlunatus speluncae TaxID=2594267 RepID=UPI00126627EA|nr:SDR family oxidoreductase [Microlunatus speluncae]